MKNSTYKNNAIKNKAFKAAPPTLALILFCLILFQGCVLIEYLSTTSETDNLKAGDSAFFMQRYDKAATIFTSIMNTSQKQDIRNLALYNLACTKLISSENEDDIIVAIKLLENWNPSNKRDMLLENPLLIVQAFQKLHLKQSKQLCDTKNIIKNQNTEIVKMKKIIKTLQHQITELENIDQEIQEKRKTNE